MNWRLELESAWDRGPDGFWRMFENPEFAVWVMHDGDGFALGGCDLVIVPLEVDGVVVVDASRAAQGEVEIEQG